MAAKENDAKQLLTSNDVDQEYSDLIKDIAKMPHGTDIILSFQNEGFQQNPTEAVYRAFMAMHSVKLMDNRETNPH